MEREREREGLLDMQERLLLRVDAKKPELTTRNILDASSSSLTLALAPNRTELSP